MKNRILLGTRAIFGILINLTIVMLQCTTPPRFEPPVEPIVPPVEVTINFRFVAYDEGIDHPDDDRRCYYKIFIDKIDVGRTTIGLESQKKYFEAKLSPNIHLIVVEKWVLDEKDGEYKKLNNILQPKPNYYYFETTATTVTELIMIHDKRSNKARFLINTN